MIHGAPKFLAHLQLKLQLLFLISVLNLQLSYWAFKYHGLLSLLSISPIGLSPSSFKAISFVCFWPLLSWAWGSNFTVKVRSLGILRRQCFCQDAQIQCARSLWDQRGSQCCLQIQVAIQLWAVFLRYFQ